MHKIVPYLKTLDWKNCWSMPVIPYFRLCFILWL